MEEKNGIEKTKIEIVKKMLDKGLSIDEIANFTDIDEETIRKIKREKN